MATIPAHENEFPSLLFAESAAPSTPASGLVIAYAKSDGLLYWKDDTGTERAVGVGDTAAHLADTSDAHDASSISFDPTGLSSVTGTEVQTAIEELDAAIVGAGGGGWGNHFLVPHAVPFTADAGTWAIGQFTAEDTYPFGGWALSCTTGALNDAVSLPAIAMDAGTWAIDYVVRRSTNTGIITIKIAGSSVGTIDTYVSPGGHIHKGSITGIAIASAGSKTLQLVMASKNASSSAYFAGIFTLNFRRTA